MSSLQHRKIINHRAAFGWCLSLALALFVTWKGTIYFKDFLYLFIEDSPWEILHTVSFIGISLPHIIIFFVSFLIVSWLRECIQFMLRKMWHPLIIVFLQFPLGVCRLMVALLVFWGGAIIIFNIVVFLTVLAFGDFTPLYSMLFAMLLSFFVSSKLNHYLRRVFH
ncbi:hypothetical protein AWU65_03705 [Paenibacillus glucanolyticus]|uniref:Uncharacterized protein n=1 Tax=Paenibacillus glucanolyticus TaxID=59843 RepID=A0A163GQT7_9BACL|nr:hypothetical protein AWU65_03705 [Paenibacillus glucanolyticus]OMF65482.1 hypothetical protein BK142_30790 [Paenibacillus glucanolyticus]